MTPPNHALQRTRPSRCGCNRGAPPSGSLGLGRSVEMKFGRWCILLYLIAATAGCERSGALMVGDVTKPQSFAVKARSNNPTGITVEVKGRIDGTAKVYIHEHAKLALNGTVDSGLYHDWFEKDCTIHFEPGSAKSGSLEISYVFE
jgi:hypothetical protein